MRRTSIRFCGRARSARASDGHAQTPRDGTLDESRRKRLFGTVFKIVLLSPAGVVGYKLGAC
jgi:hypothetical protein